MKKKNRTDGNTVKKKEKTQTPECIKNTVLFMSFSSKTHQKYKNVTKKKMNALICIVKC